MRFIGGISCHLQALARRPSSLGDTEWPRESARLGQRHFPRSEEADDHEAPTLIWPIAKRLGRVVCDSV